jgi:hypothetical protein
MYGTVEEVALVTGVAATLVGVDASYIGATECSDASRRLLMGAPRRLDPLTAVSIAFDISMPVRASHHGGTFILWVARALVPFAAVVVVAGKTDEREYAVERRCHTPRLRRLLIGTARRPSWFGSDRRVDDNGSSDSWPSSRCPLPGCFAVAVIHRRLRCPRPPPQASAVADDAVTDGAVLASVVSLDLAAAITSGNLTAAIASAAAAVGSSAFAAASVTGHSVMTQSPTSAPTSAPTSSNNAVATPTRAESGIPMLGWVILVMLVVVFLCAAAAVVMMVRRSRSSKPAAVPDWSNNKPKQASAAASSAKPATVERRHAQRKQLELGSDDTSDDDERELAGEAAGQLKLGSDDESDDDEREKDGEAAGADRFASDDVRQIVIHVEDEIEIAIGPEISIPIDFGPEDPIDFDPEITVAPASRIAPHGTFLPPSKTTKTTTPRDNAAQLNASTTKDVPIDFGPEIPVVPASRIAPRGTFLPSRTTTTTTTTPRDNAAQLNPSTMEAAGAAVAADDEAWFELDFHFDDDADADAAGSSTSS